LEETENKAGDESPNKNKSEDSLSICFANDVQSPDIRADSGEINEFPLLFLINNYSPIE
jgi:hypothetical protein